ncbi:SnoaL-like protein [Dongia mobilis]|uniref:SnoaL-like protein n=1 Tax=Dongia mobilis TaxID=578943 RepID=A0A4R6WVS0_9PROT|nr:nuclear transport factor 2 family protein [Dongia mobilis]TDQ81348.1 SnoaL-like protein [Dongia mobilis]
MSDAEPGGLLAANDAFYRAFTTGDISAMQALWAGNGPAFCCHPGWPPIVDREQVLSSWQDILGQGGASDIVFMLLQSAEWGETGIVCGIELLGSAQFSCTNVFVRAGRDWRMVHHHAGPLAPAARLNLSGTADPGRSVRH